MNTTKLVCAVVSVLILGSSIAVFRSSAPTVYGAPRTAASMLEGRPVSPMPGLVVYADSVRQATVGTLLDMHVPSTTGVSAFDIESLDLGSQLHMPYYSFGTRLHTLIKD